MKWYKNKSISAKLIIGFLAAIVISIVVGVVGIINLTTMKEDVSILYNQNALGLEYGGNAATVFQMCRYNTLRLTTYDNKTDIDAGITKVNELLTQMDGALDQLDSVLYSTEARGYFDTIHQDFETYKTAAAEVVEYARNMKSIMALQTVEEKLAPVGTAIRDNFIALNQIVAEHANERANDSIKQANISMWIMIAVIAVGVAISLFLAVYISRLIGKPVKQMADAAEKLALGDVDLSIHVDTKDEVGKLGDAFNTLISGRKKQVAEIQHLAEGNLTVDIKMKSDKDILNQSLQSLIINLNELVSSIMSSADQVLSGSNLISNTSITLSQGATEQASSVQQLTASIQEIASQTTLNAKNAETANEYAKSAKSDAEKGNAQMKGMLDAMEDINQSSSSISKIIKVIDDIAFQTNILALNAAVEAARAGQHGKGFAVVAEEVRNLAAKSAQAAKETTELIEGSVRKVEAGTKIANDTADALKKIVNEVAKAADLVAEIAAASNEQAVAIEQVNQGVVQISSVVQNNAATSEESAAASEELNSQAEQLKEIISAFKIKDDVVHRNALGSGKTPTARIEASKKSHAASNFSRPAISLSDSNMGKY